MQGPQLTGNLRIPSSITNSLRIHLTLPTSNCVNFSMNGTSMSVHWKPHEKIFGKDCIYGCGSTTLVSMVAWPSLGSTSCAGYVPIVARHPSWSHDSITAIRPMHLSSTRTCRPGFSTDWRSPDWSIKIAILIDQRGCDRTNNRGLLIDHNPF